MKHMMLRSSRFNGLIWQSTAADRLRVPILTYRTTWTESRSALFYGFESRLFGLVPLPGDVFLFCESPEWFGDRVDVFNEPRAPDDGAA
jgi:hypothetical protein